MASARHAFGLVVEREGPCSAFQHVHKERLLTEPQQMLPWDWDIDTQVSGSTLAFMGEHHNGTMYNYISPDDPDVERTYLLDVNMASGERERGNGNNIIDARWIDIRNGLYIDITGLSETHPDDNPGVWSCKNYHRYHTTDLYPMRESLYEGVVAKVPYAYDRILTQEYKEKALILTDYEGYFPPNVHLSDLLADSIIAIDGIQTSKSGSRKLTRRSHKRKPRPKPRRRRRRKKKSAKKQKRRRQRRKANPTRRNMTSELCLSSQATSSSNKKPPDLHIYDGGETWTYNPILPAASPITLHHTRASILPCDLDYDLPFSNFPAFSQRRALSIWAALALHYGLGPERPRFCQKVYIEQSWMGKAPACLFHNLTILITYHTYAPLYHYTLDTFSCFSSSVQIPFYQVARNAWLLHHQLAFRSSSDTVGISRERE